MTKRKIPQVANVWREIKTEGPDGTKYDYEQVLSQPVSQSMAEVMVRLMETEYPNESYTMSHSKPRTYIL